MSDSSQISLAYGPAETVYGETPSGNPTLKELPWSSEDLQKNTNTSRSSNVRGDGRANKLRRQGFSAGGALSANFMYGDFDDMIRRVVRAAAWTTPQTVTATTISVESIATSSSSLAKIKDSANGFGSFVAGQWVKITGLTGQIPDNEFHQIVNATAAELEVTGDFVDNAAGASITVYMGPQVTDATTVETFPIERKHGGLSNVYDFYTGCFVSQMDLSVTDQNDIDVTFEFGAKDEFDGGGSTIGDGSNTAETGNPTMNATDNVVAILADGSIHDVKSLQLTINPKLEGRTFVGVAGFKNVKRGAFEVTGSYQVLFQSQALMNKYRNFQSMAIILILTDDDGNSYLIDTPSVKPSSAKNSPGQGQDNDTLLDMNFEAEPDDLQQIVVRIVKFDKP
jgi:acylphosphatase